MNAENMKNNNGKNTGVDFNTVCILFYFIHFIRHFMQVSCHVIEVIRHFIQVIFHFVRVICYFVGIKALHHHATDE